MKTNRKGFTLVEIMIVVAIIALLAAIAIPSFLKSRTSARTSACINNLRLLDHAQNEYATASNLPEATVCTIAAVLPWMKGSVEPFCPQGTATDHYSFPGPSISNPPVCPVVATWTDHVLKPGA
jgi:prepilin-type N-terminal cleavage/methylation domain-containing protein